MVTPTSAGMVSMALRNVQQTNCTANKVQTSVKYDKSMILIVPVPAGSHQHVTVVVDQTNGWVVLVQSTAHSHQSAFHLRQWSYKALYPTNVHS